MLIDPDGRTTGRRGPRRTRRPTCWSGPSARWSPPAGSTTRPTRWSAQGRLAVYPSSHGQEACQVAAAQVLARRRLAVPDLPRHRRRRRPRRRPGRGADAAARRLALRLRPVRAPASRRSAPRWPPSCCTPSASRTPPGCKGEDTVALAHVRRRRHQRGRLPRGAELRRRLPGPGRLLRAEQRVRDLACRWPGRPPRRRWRTRASGTACPASRSTATTWPPCSRCSARRSRTPAPATGRTLVEAHTYRMRGAHQRRRRHPLPRRRRGRGVASRATRSPGWRRTCARAALLDDDGVAAVADEAEALAARPARRHERATPTVDPMDLFAHVYAEPTPQLREQARAGCRAELDAEGDAR